MEKRQGMIWEHLPQFDGEQIGIKVQALEVKPAPVYSDRYQGMDRLDLSKAMIDGDGVRSILGASVLPWLGEQIAGFAFSKIAEWGYNSILNAFAAPENELKLKDVMKEMTKIQKQLDHMNELLGKIMEKLDDIIRNQKLESLRNHIRSKQEKVLVLSAAVDQTLGNLLDKQANETRQRQELANWYHSPINGSQNALQATLVFARTLMDQTTGYEMFSAYDKFMELSNYGWERQTYAFREMMRDCDMTLFLNAAMLTSLYFRSQLDAQGDQSDYDVRLLNETIKEMNKYYKEHQLQRLPEGANRFIGNKNNILIYKLVDTGKRAMHRDGYTINPRTWKNFRVDENGKNRLINEKEVQAICSYYQGKEFLKYLAEGGFILSQISVDEKGVYVIWIDDKPQMFRNGNAYKFQPMAFFSMGEKSRSEGWVKFFLPGPQLELADQGTRYIRTLEDYDWHCYSLFVEDSSV